MAVLEIYDYYDNKSCKTYQPINYQFEVKNTKNSKLKNIFQFFCNSKIS